MVGILLSYWGCQFSGAFAVSFRESKRTFSGFGESEKTPDSLVGLSSGILEVLADFQVSPHLCGQRAFIELQEKHFDTWT